MNKASILDAVDRLSNTLSKVKDFDVSKIDLSERVLDNRIITLEGYLRFLETEGIPKLEAVRSKLRQEGE